MEAEEIINQYTQLLSDMSHGQNVGIDLYMPPQQIEYIYQQSTNNDIIGALLNYII